jgi:hypothetical protein
MARFKMTSVIGMAPCQGLERTLHAMRHYLPLLHLSPAPAGHVFSIDFSAAYNNWDRTDPAELFDAQTKKNESNPKARFAGWQTWSMRAPLAAKHDPDHTKLTSGGKGHGCKLTFDATPRCQPRQNSDLTHAGEMCAVKCTTALGSVSHTGPGGTMLAHDLT